MATDSSIYQPQRRYKRRRISVRVALLVDSLFYFQTATEIGEGGMLVQVTSPLSKGHSVEVSFFLPTGEFVSTRAEIVYAIEPRPLVYYVGVCFHDLSEKAADDIRAYVEAYR